LIVSLIAAMAENRVIGRDNALPWRLPSDMKHFKELTIGHTVIMGRKTYDSMGQPLMERRNVVISRDPGLTYDGAEVVSSLEDALGLAAGEDEVFVAGGAEIYRLALPRADRIYLTVVHTAVEGDTHFPEFDMAEWQLAEDVRHESDERHHYGFSFRLYHRREDATE
jgi:dihydrofolate reductase